LDYTYIMDRLTQAYSNVLGPNFVGMYVHGSIAMGCFHPQKSDIDFVCVVHNEPDAEQKLRILEATVAYERFAPEKGLEMHILLLEDCLHPTHPCPFCLHYSHAYWRAFLSDPLGLIASMHGRDPDLGGHLTILHACGVCWKGAPVQEVFAPVPKEMYLSSILDDVIPGCGDDIYRLCNLCRVWGYLAEGLVLSKRTGPQWALSQSEGPAKAIRAALDSYNAGTAWNESFCADEACAWLQRKIISLLPEEFARNYT